MPGANWKLRGSTYEGIEWFDSRPKPSKASVLAEVAKIKEAYDACEYQRKRHDAYPGIREQLDMLYHDDIEGWRAEIKKIKDHFPK